MSRRSNRKLNDSMIKAQSSGYRNAWVLVTTALFCLAGFTSLATPPKIGDEAPDFTLKTLHGATMNLHKETAKRDVVLVVLRGWPGYQCPLCEKQVHDLAMNAAEIEK